LKTEHGDGGSRGKFRSITESNAKPTKKMYGSSAATGKFELENRRAERRVGIEVRNWCFTEVNQKSTGKQLKKRWHTEPESVYYVPWKEKGELFGPMTEEPIKEGITAAKI